MRGFQRQPAGTVEAALDPEEAVLLQSLAGQVAEVIEEDVLRRAQEVSTGSTHPNGVSTGSTHPNGASTGSTHPSDDSALTRLLPDAYPGDAEASAEFRRFTQSGLAERKVQNAQTLIRSLEGSGVTGGVTLDEQEALAWLRCLTDIRLVIASRLGIDTEDDDAGRSIDPLMREIYDWLGFVQNSLVEAVDGRASHG